VNTTFDGSKGPSTPEGWSPRPTCTARTKRGPCKNSPIKGGTVCRFHGGSAPQVLAAAAKRRADEQRRAALAEWGTTYGEIGPADDPAVVMAELIQRSRGSVRWLLERVQETEAEALVWGLTSRVERDGGEFPGVDTTYSADINGWVRLYNDERDRLVRMIAVASRMGLDERLVRLAEVQTAAMFAILNRAFDAMKLTAEQRALIPQIIRGVVEERPELAGGASAAA
jgi:hypothetical protein